LNEYEDDDYDDDEDSDDEDRKKRDIISGGRDENSFDQRLLEAEDLCQICTLAGDTNIE